jgi:hypothetical protein
MPPLIWVYRKGDGTCYRRQKKWPIRAQDMKEETKPHMHKLELQIMKMATIQYLTGATMKTLKTPKLCPYTTMVCRGK